jgi:prevent-host-death family protein
VKTGTDAVGAFEAKNRFSDPLDRVGRGAEITITTDDRPAAKIVPASDHSNAIRKQAIADLRAMRKRYELKDVTARELITEGRT